MSRDIDQHILTALAKVRAHADHWLLPIHRRALYDVLDPVKSTPIQSQVRPWLDLYAARYVLPLWDPILQDPEYIWKDYYHLPSQMVSLLEGLLHATADTNSVSDLAYHWAEVSSLTGELPSSQFYHAWCVYKAALKALLYTLGNDSFSQADYFSDTTTQIEDVYGDTANWAAIAFAGGVWQPDLPLQEEMGRVFGHWNRDLDDIRATLSNTDMDVRQFQRRALNANLKALVQQRQRRYAADL